MSLSQIVAHGLSLMEGNESSNFSDVFSELLQSQSYVPTVDIIDKGTELNLYINVPGVKPETIDVNFYNNVVNVKGQRVRPYINTNCSVYKNEVIYGIFERNIGIPISVTNRDSVSISLSDGVLFISIDKSVEERNRFSVRMNASGVQTSGNATVTINDNSSNVNNSNNSSSATNYISTPPRRTSSEPLAPPGAPSKKSTRRRRIVEDYIQEQGSQGSEERSEEQISPCALYTCDISSVESDSE